MSGRMPQLAALVERLLPWIMLGILGAFTYAFVFQVPYLGFRYSSGVVVEVYLPDSALQSEDRIVSVGAVTWEQFDSDLTQTWLSGQQPGDTIRLRFARDGQKHAVTWVLPGRTVPEVAQRLNSQWWIGYVFWLAGTATLFLVRPRDRRWALLVAFNYLTALWLTVGSVSSWHVWLSALLLRAAVWLSVPVYLHLHWAFPSPLGRLPAPVLWLAYGASVLLAAAQWLQLIPASAYLLGLLLALVGSVILLILHAWRRPGDRRDLGFLALAMGTVALPPAAIAAASLVGVALPGPLRGAAFLAFPAVAGAYFFVLYRRQLDRQLAARANRLAIVYLCLIFAGLIFIIAAALAMGRLALAPSNVFAGATATLLAAVMALTSFGPFLLLPALAGAYVPVATDSRAELHLRANRLLAPFLFFVLLLVALATVVLLLLATFDFPGEEVVDGLVVALLAAGIVVVGYRPFQRFVDRRLLGVRLPPTRLPETFAARITTTLDRETLARLLADEVLPSLLVRQAVILLLDDAGDGEPFLTYGLTEHALPDREQVAALLARMGAGAVMLPDGSEGLLPGWMRLALALNYGERTIGLWLLGRRDPDDLYSRAELPMFEALANQMAVALTNLVQTENLRALYRENIDRHEAERARLARALHDEVLSRLAVLALFAGDEIPPESQRAYEALTAQLRQTIAGLRPAMLQYGLRAALQELVDERAEHTNGEPRLELAVPSSEARYEATVEQHLFRIVQQAVENAVKHAQAQCIVIGGQLDTDRAELWVEDDGVGLQGGEHLDLTGLLAGKHFGLAGMVERAELIDADLRITSAPGQGTRIRLLWTSQD